ncbi:hypothetical protein [Oscillatoria sp. FACHB-1406]|uniref:hypothetical protein n=1 Tax=Oscillatoria sp. FACHB-1406 TaxID=2692846 RepID=UPI0016845CDB|nr:hypothetical protein [Oscillatoria sp. FACHB-1406]MBD2579083.1 hypothetical protein [Oscillatoria sp. FACHB-1406]
MFKVSACDLRRVGTLIWEPDREFWLLLYSATYLRMSVLLNAQKSWLVGAAYPTECLYPIS